MANDKDIEAGVKNPPSNCQCLNPRVLYSIRSALSGDLERSEGALEWLEKHIKEGSGTNKEMLELRIQRDMILSGQRETAKVLNVINMIPVCTFAPTEKEGNPYPKRLTVPEKHQLRIAKDTLKMSDAMAGVMGGMSKEEAREVIKQLEAKK